MSWVAGPGADGKHEEILVVDDNPTTRYATARTLRAAGFHTREAATGTEALQLADGTLSAVVLDVHLPDLDGFEVCRRLRDRADTARLPLIHLSAAHVRDQDKLQGVYAGADAYMTHPADPELLVATLTALVRARTAEEGMRRSEVRFKAIFDQAFTGICLIDAAGRLISANPAMCTILQEHEAAWIGRPVVEMIDPAERPRFREWLAHREQGVWRSEFRALNALGQAVPLQWSMSAHVEPGLSVAVVVDISERVALAEEREALLEREQAARSAAEQLARSKDEFIALVSHELRTPLSAILGWTQMLRRLQPEGKMARGLEVIERSARAQTQLIGALLELSRMDLGKLRMNWQETRPEEVVQSAVAALESAVEDKQLTLLLDLQAADGTVISDPDRLEQIVWNLLSNAIKFSRQQGTVWLTLRRDEKSWSLQVRDDGRGISADFLPHLFERFTQGDAATNRTHGGLGLGLSIVKQLVELHGGQLHAHSDGPGQGACFDLMLPNTPNAVHPVASARPDSDDTEHRLGSEADLSDVDILVVEDDPEAGKMLAIILQDRGARVRLATHYDAAMQLLRQTPPQVLISDLGLPGKDGYTLMRDWRQQEPPGQRIPALALSAFSRAKDVEQALEAGFTAHCAKPFRVQELMDLVQSWIRPAG
ncbi:hybrid sensor histidine kinase/response regulator [Chitiniphilus shinanonensis]|uniref:hybrid sensor histidine kinase/response regulator n=1 Tax=Chitiniphilus shinanonensis TaxID=553088 RepID=UPI00306C9D68